MFFPSLPFFLLWILWAAQPVWSQVGSYEFETHTIGWTTAGDSGCQKLTHTAGASGTLTVNLDTSTSAHLLIIGNIPDDPSIISATVDGQPFTIPSRPADAGPCNAILFAGDQLGQHVFVFTLKGSATGEGIDFFGFKTVFVSIPPPDANPKVPGTTSALPSSSTPNVPGDTSTPAPSNGNVGAIAGGTVGGIAGLFAAIGAFLLAKSNLPWVSASLAALLGLFAYRTRRLVFIADENIPESQFAFFLTSKNEFTKFERPVLVWTVARIGNTQRRFELDVPCRIGHGLTRLCYGTITDNGTHVTLDSWAEAPALFDVATGTWDKCPEAKGQPKFLSATKVYANPGDAASDGDSDQIVLGTGEEEKGEMKPFLLINPEEFKTEYRAGTDLYIHAFRVRNDCQSGQYGDKLSQDVINDRITPIKGIHVKELAPLTTWSFKQDAKGKLTIRVVENDKSELKAFKHDFSVKKMKKKSIV